MRAVTVGLTLILACAALAGCNKKEEGKSAPAEAVAAAPAAEVAPPTRKPGLWTQTIVSDGRTTAMKLCTDAEFEKTSSWTAGQSAAGVCDKTQMTKNPDGSWTFHSACDMGSGGKTVTDGTATGDFATKFEFKATTTTAGAQVPQMNGAHDMTMTSEWGGACPAGWVAGEMEMPGVGKINVTAMLQAQKNAMAATKK